MDGTAPHVRLPVADLDRSIAFYRDVLGLRLRVRLPSVAALLAPGGAQGINLDLWRGAARAHGHAALLCPDRPSLARMLARVVAAGVTIDASVDNGVGEAVYLRDPDGNGVELHRDRPESEWPRPRPHQATTLNRPLDLHALLAPDV